MEPRGQDAHGGDARASPAISAVVIAYHDENRIAEVMEALVGQETDGEVELILVTSGGDATAEVVRRGFPQVKVVELPEPALPGEARNVGLRLARGEYVTFPGSHVVVQPGALAAMVRAHRLGHTMVTGSVVNGCRSLSGWASYFLDHSPALPGRPSGELASAPGHCSYLRRPLVELGGFPEDRRTGEDTYVNQALWRRGHTACRASDVAIRHNSPCTSPIRLVRHHYKRGVGYGRVLLESSRRSSPSDGRRPGRLSLVLYLCLRYPLRRVRFVARNVMRWGKGVRRWFWLSLPLMCLAVAAAALGAVRHVLWPSRRPDAPG